MKRTIKVSETEYRKMKRAVERQEKARRLVYELWLLFSNVSSDASDSDKK